MAYHSPKDAGLTGTFAENDALGAAKLVKLPKSAVGPEDLAVLPDGTVYNVDLGGTLYRIDGADAGGCGSAGWPASKD